MLCALSIKIQIVLKVIFKKIIKPRWLKSESSWTSKKGSIIIKNFYKYHLRFIPVYFRPNFSWCLSSDLQESRNLFGDTQVTFLSEILVLRNFWHFSWLFVVDVLQIQNIHFLKPFSAFDSYDLFTHFCLNNYITTQPTPNRPNFVCFTSENLLWAN